MTISDHTLQMLGQAQTECLLANGKQPHESVCSDAAIQRLVRLRNEDRLAEAGSVSPINPSPVACVASVGQPRVSLDHSLHAPISAGDH